jgi:L-ribulose-5-phosphate 3-epimerase
MRPDSMNEAPGFALGIYEKALPLNVSLQKKLSIAADLRFDFMEMSIDPSEEKLNRLDWSQTKRRAIKLYMNEANLSIRSICLSANRFFPLGSRIFERRKKGLTIIRKAIELASDIGVRIVQVAGYDTYNEPSNRDSNQRYIYGLYQATMWASEHSVLLGIENQETSFVNSPTIAIEIIREINSPYLQLYMDVGNLVVAKLDIESEIKAAEGHLLGVHIKDAKPDTPRRVPFGDGDVPFDLVFQLLRDIRFQGLATIEMWNDDKPNSKEVCAEARAKVLSYLRVFTESQDQKLLGISHLSPTSLQEKNQ